MEEPDFGPFANFAEFGPLRDPRIIEPEPLPEDDPEDQYILQIGDVHYGKDQSPDYNFDAGRIMSRIPDMIDLRGEKVKITWMGDIIEGMSNYAEQDLESESINTQIIGFQDAVIRLDRALRNMNNNINHYCVAGNHGRVKRTRPLSRDNTERIIYENLKRMIPDGFSRVKIAEKEFGFTSVNGFRIMLHHGHGIRSYGGFPIGGLIKFLINAGNRNQKFDIALLGHSHKMFADMMPSGHRRYKRLFISGCFPYPDNLNPTALHGNARGFWLHKIYADGRRVSSTQFLLDEWGL